jgi:hypothetical protein
MTCQDDLIEFRERMETLKNERAEIKRQIKSEDSKVAGDRIVHEENL